VLNNGRKQQHRIGVLYTVRAIAIDGAIEELLEGVFSVRSVLKCYKADKSIIYLVVRQSSASKDLNTGAEEVTALEAVTR
jgi:hypothetical protein